MVTYQEMAEPSVLKVGTVTLPLLWGCAQAAGSVGDDQKGAKIFTPPPQIKSLGFLTAEIPNFEIFYQNFKYITHKNMETGRL